MDYGQGSQFAGNGNQPFFTAGAGDTSVNRNNFESENNLDLTNTSSWGQSRDYREIGNRAFMSPADLLENTEDIQSYPEQSQEQNQQADLVFVDRQGSYDTDLAMPPTMADLPSDSTPTTSYDKYDKQSIRSDGDHINNRAISEIKQAMSKLSQTDNIADFYSTIRGGDNAPGMLQDYLKNSYNREVA